MRDEIEGLVRAEVVNERIKEKECIEAHFKEAMVKELDIITKAIQEEAQTQMHTQLQNMRYVRKSRK
jgi:hypothetical protein